jgi:ribosome biogenesis GTPase
MKNIGRVIKGVASQFVVQIGGEMVECTAKGKLKLDGDIYIGDFVEVEDGKIVGVKPRKNVLIRPYVANIDYLAIVLAIKPAPDLLLCDKLLINAYENDIEPVICINKDDISDREFTHSIEKDYGDFVDILKFSAKNETISVFSRFFDGKFVSLAGQSAVGKTSIINALAGEHLQDVGELSRKIDRGKHTTRHNQIFGIGTMTIIDTAGFSSLSMNVMREDELRRFYPDFEKWAEDCKFRGCLHILEEGCGVKQAVEKNKLSKNRYERYVVLYNETKEAWKNQWR